MLDVERHCDAGWRRPTSYAHFGAETACPVLMAELAQIVAYFPLAFIALPTVVDGGEAEVFHLVAVLGLRQGRNLYVSKDGYWTAPYVPSHVRQYPFRLAATGPAEGGGFALELDRTSGCWADRATAGVERFFDDSGRPSEALAQVERFARSRQASQAQTRELVAQLARHGLIQPWPIRWHPHAGDADAVRAAKVQTLGGFHGVDEEALLALDPGVLAELARSGALALAYAQLLSRARVLDLNARHVRGQTGRSMAAPQPEAASVDLELIFGGKQDDDLLKF